MLKYAVSEILPIILALKTFDTTFENALYVYCDPVYENRSLGYDVWQRLKAMFFIVVVLLIQ